MPNEPARRSQRPSAAGSWSIPAASGFRRATSAAFALAA